MADPIMETMGVKIIYLIRRRPNVTREQLIAHWFANHMPKVIANQQRSAAQGRRHAHRYIATLFDERPDRVWDGMAQLWWDEPLPRPKAPHGASPTDSFQEKAEPYLPWTTEEYVVMDGELPLEPLTLDNAFPCTRSGFYKKSFLVKAKPETDFAAMFAHWLEVHVPNVRSCMEQVGGFRYCVSTSLDPENEPYAGLAELYFHDAEGWDAYKRINRADGMEQFVDLGNMYTPGSSTEMVGIP